MFNIFKTTEQKLKEQEARTEELSGKQIHMIRGLGSVAKNHARWEIESAISKIIDPQISSKEEFLRSIKNLNDIANKEKPVIEKIVYLAQKDYFQCHALRSHQIPAYESCREKIYPMIEEEIENKKEEIIEIINEIGSHYTMYVDEVNRDVEDLNSFFSHEFLKNKKMPNIILASRLTLISLGSNEYFGKNKRPITDVKEFFKNSYDIEVKIDEAIPYGELFVI